MKPRLGVFKFASCDGCQLQILNAEDELLALAEALDLAYFPEASSRQKPGPYDIALVEGSITTAADAERIVRVRADSRVLVTIGACATAGGIQALRNWARRRGVQARGLPESRSGSRRCPPRRRSRRTCASTTSCGAARSTSSSC